MVIENQRTGDGRLDIIGDIHGHAVELRALLELLGYRETRGAYRHPDGRRLVFLGDFIDRGPAILEVLRIARAMVEERTAFAIMGNHEMNAMRFHSRGADGMPLREHTEKNISQHRATLDQIPSDQMDGWLEWFSGLPLWMDFEGCRVVHACWDDEAIRAMTGIGPFCGNVLESYSRKGTPEHDTISRILNGPEAKLPVGHKHQTADSNYRRDIRVKWWVPIEGLTCREAIFPPADGIPDLPTEAMPAITPYGETDPPVFFGHYAQKATAPSPIRKNIACLDYGTGKGGFLCAYRWDGEQVLETGKFVSVNE